MNVKRVRVGHVPPRWTGDGSKRTSFTMAFEPEGNFFKTVQRLSANQGHQDVELGAEVDLEPVPLSSVIPGRIDAATTAEYARDKFVKLGEVESACGEWRIVLAAPLGLNPLAKDDADFYNIFAFVHSKELDLVVAGSRLTAEFDATLQVEAFSPAGDLLPFRTKWVNDVETPSRIIQEGKLNWGFGATTAIFTIGLDDIVTAVRFVGQATLTLEFGLTYTRKERHVFPIGHLSSEPLHLITSHLSLLDIQNLMQVIPNLRPELQGIAASRMRCVLAPYFADVEQFAAALDSAGGIVGGSAALSVLCPGDWSPGDVDIIVGPLGFRIISDYLTADGYIHDEEASKTQFYPNDIRLAFGYTLWTKGDRKVDVSVSRLHTPIDFLMTYHCTAVMNFFAGGEIHCLFPHLTFKGHYQGNLFTLRPDTAKFDKIHERGFTRTDPENLQDGYLMPLQANRDDRAFARLGGERRWMLRRKWFVHKVWRTQASIA